MANAETVIQSIRSLGPEEKRKVREYLYAEGEVELRARVEQGIEALDRGERVDGQAAFGGLRQRAHELARGK